MAQKEQLVLIYGDDGFRVTREAKKRIEKLVPDGNRDFGLEVIDGNVQTDEEIAHAVNSCMGAVSTPGFFGGKTVWFKDVSFLVPKKKSDEDDDEPGGNAGEMVAALLEFLKKGIPEGQTLIISTTKISQNSAFFRHCKANGTLQEFVAERNVTEILKELLQEKQLSMSPATQDVFLERVGTDTRMILEELEKLALYIYPRQEVHGDDIAAITSSIKEGKTWELLYTINARNAKQAMALIDELSVQKGIHMMLEAMLQNHVRDLIVLREAADRGWIRGGAWRNDLEPATQVLLSTLPVNPKTLAGNKLYGKLRGAMNYSLLELRIARSKLMEMREKFVMSQQQPLELLRNTVLEIINAPGRKVR